MKLGQLEPGIVLTRVNRFVATVRTQRGEELAHLTNSGRLTDVLGPGHEVGLRRVCPSVARRTSLDVVLMQNQAGRWVGVDTRLPPALLAEAIEKGMIAPFTTPVCLKREVKWGTSRFDLRVDDWLVETKSVTLVRDGRGLFPDAPTQRGRRHLQELREARQEGLKTMVAFVVQRDDAECLTAHREIDPAFAAELRLARDAGVALRAFASQVGLEHIVITTEIPVEI